VNLTALSAAIDMLWLFPDQHRRLFDGDRRARDGAQLAPVEFEQAAADHDLLGLEGYFSSSLHRSVPSSSGNSINRPWAGSSMALARPIIASFNKGAALRSTRSDRPPLGLALTTRPTLARMARLSLLRRLEFSFTFFGGPECSQ